MSRGSGQSRFLKKGVPMEYVEPLLIDYFKCFERTICYNAIERTIRKERRTMPRPKKYADDATRAAAWRYRQQQEQLQIAEIARQAQRLHHLLQRSATDGNDEARTLVGQNVAGTLKKLQQHFQQGA